jgi:hypothetical protein
MKYYIILFPAFLFSSCNIQYDTGLSDQSLNNLIAFTKIYGYIRFFHPSDEAQKIAWDKFAIYGIKKVENAKNSDELKLILQEIFQPLAPTLKIYEQGDISHNKPYVPPDTSKLEVIIWKHYGVGGLSNEGHNV